jgi:hypothetical protein
VLSARWLLDTAQDDEREKAAASSEAATVHEMAGSDLVAATAALSRQKEAQLAAKEAMGLRELSRNNEAAKLMKTFLQANDALLPHALPLTRSPYPHPYPRPHPSFPCP